MGGERGETGGRNGENPACHSSIEEWMLHKRLHSGHPYHAGDRQAEGKFDRTSRKRIRQTRAKTGTSEVQLQVGITVKIKQGLIFFFIETKEKQKS